MTAADRNLLFGILALQHNFISRDALFAAFNTWVADKSRDLGSLLHARNELTAKQLTLLTELVEECIQRAGSAKVCLEQVSAISAVRDDLESLSDTDLQASLQYVSQRTVQYFPSQPSTIASPSVGAASTVGNRFRILRRHAEGGLGVVWAAHDEELNREVALKEIKGKYADDPESRARFTLEAEITGGLEHPGIVPVYGLGKYSDGRPFYAMRFIRGDSLSTAIQDFHATQLTETERNLRLRRLLQRFIDVCEAMHYAHARGVLHRDLKPANIMLGKYGETLVVDWGLARAGVGKESDKPKPTGDETRLQPKSGSSATLVGAVVGTPAYMAPEQAAGRLDLLGPATDIYALGATLYSILTGRPPLEGKSTAQLLQNSQQGRIVPLQRHTRHVPKALEAICLQALALEPGARFATARLLAEDVEHWLADEPVAAYPEPLVTRARRALRKRPMVTGSIFATLLVGLVAFAIGWFVVGNKNRELSRTNADLVLARKTAIEQRNEAKRQEQIAITQKKAAEDNATLATLNAEQAALEKERLSKAMKFLVAAFEKPDPVADGRELKAADLLLTAAREAQQTFADEPVLQAELLNNLYYTLRGLGLYVESLPIAETAFRLREEVLGPNDPATIQALSDLGGAYLGLSEHGKAVPLIEETLRRRQANANLEDPELPAAMINLASVYHLTRQYDKAFALFEQALPMLKAQLGSDHEDTVLAMGNLANLYGSAKQHDKAIALLKEVVQDLQLKLPADDPFLLGSVHNLAVAYERAGQIDQAVPLHEDILQKRRDKLGDDHPNTLASMHELVALYPKVRQFRKAVSLGEEAMERFRRKFGLDHNDTLFMTTKLADSYRAVNQPAKAIPLYEETLLRYRSKHGSVHNLTREAMMNMMRVYIETEQVEKVTPIWQEFVAATRELFPPESLELGDFLAQGAWTLLQAKAWSPAETAFRESLDIYLKRQPDAWQTFNNRALLGAALAGRGAEVSAIDKPAAAELFAEAEPLLKDGLQGMHERSDKIVGDSRLWFPIVTQRLVDLYTAWEKPAEAEKWKVELEKLKADVGKPR